MAFVLAQSDSYSWPVTVEFPVDGGRFEKQTFDAEFKRLPQSRIEQVIERSNTDTIKDAEFAREVITGWQGVTDAKGADVPYSNEALSKLLDVPLVAGAIVQAFFASLTGAKRKNQKPLLSIGQVAALQMKQLKMRQVQALSCQTCRNNPLTLKYGKTTGKQL